MMALFYAIKNDIKSLEVCYDYDGIRKWVTGEWNAKKRITRLYRDWMRNKIETFHILVQWTHITGHTGNPGNEAADSLAKEATQQ